MRRDHTGFSGRVAAQNGHASTLAARERGPAAAVLCPDGGPLLIVRSIVIYHTMWRIYHMLAYPAAFAVSSNPARGALRAGVQRTAPGEE